MLKETLKYCAIAYLLVTVPVCLFMFSFNTYFIANWCGIWFLIFLYLFSIILIIRSVRYYIKRKQRQKIRVEIIPTTSSTPTANQQYVSSDIIYRKRPFMTAAEREFYNKIKCLEDEMDLKIVPQVNLASIIKKERHTEYYTDLFRNIDFAIFDSKMFEVLLLIELNDRTHEQKDRIHRDIKIRSICQQSDINLITFYTKYSNEQDYVLNRIKNEIRSRYAYYR